MASPRARASLSRIRTSAAAPSEIDDELAGVTVPPGMIYIPGGKTHIGSTAGLAAEQPVFLAEVRPFFLDEHPVTVAEFRQFVAATATIQGETVAVEQPQVPAPTAVRFGWRETAQPNLVNKEGLPAYPFRTNGPDWHPAMRTVSASAAAAAPTP